MKAYIHYPDQPAYRAAIRINRPQVRVDLPAVPTAKQSDYQVHAMRGEWTRVWYGSTGAHFILVRGEFMPVTFTGRWKEGKDNITYSLRRRRRPSAQLPRA